MSLIQFIYNVLRQWPLRQLLLSVGLILFSLQACVAKKPQNSVTCWNLTPEAQVTYGILLLEQSIRAGDKSGVLEAMGILVKYKPAPQFFTDSATWFLLEKDPITARTILDQGIQLLPDEFGFYLLLADCWLEENQPMKALEILQAYQVRYPQSDLVRQELAILYLKIGNYKEAVDIFSSLPKEYYNAFIRYCYAQSLAALGHSSKAMYQLQLAVKENPEFLEAWFETGKLLEKNGNYAEAIKVYLDLLDKDSSNQSIRLHLISSMLALKRSDQALKYVFDNSESYSFCLTAVTLFLENKCYTQAELLLNKIKEHTEAKSDINVILYILGAIEYEYYKNYNKALILLEQANSTDKYYINTLLLRTEILYSLNKKDEAMQLLHQAQEINPLEQELWKTEIQLLLGEKAYIEALNVANKGLEVFPEEKTILFLKGVALNGLGEKHESLELMEQIISSYPDYPEVLNFVGYCLIEEKRDIERAFLLIEKANSLIPNRAYIVDSLAWALFIKGEIKKAWTEINRAISLEGSNDPTIWDHYGDIARAIGKKADAKIGWEKAIKLQPQDVEAIQKKLQGL